MDTEDSLQELALQELATIEERTLDRGALMHADPLWMKSLLVVHVAAGFGSFLLAPVALVTAKGGRAHKRWGMVYLWSMGTVAMTAFPMALYRPVLFLALVAVFSFYWAFSGYRVLRLKDLAKGGKARPIDWFAGVFAFSAGLALVLLALLRPAAVQHMGIVAIVFGLLCMRVAGIQMGSFVRKPTEKMFWWYSHLNNFIASYIAAWSAFSVVTLPRLFGNHLWLWLWPYSDRCSRDHRHDRILQTKVQAESKDSIAGHSNLRDSPSPWTWSRLS